MLDSTIETSLASGLWYHSVVMLSDCRSYIMPSSACARLEMQRRRHSGKRRRGLTSRRSAKNRQLWRSKTRLQLLQRLLLQRELLWRTQQVVDLRRRDGRSQPLQSLMWATRTSRCSRIWWAGIGPSSMPLNPTRPTASRSSSRPLAGRMEQRRSWLVWPGRPSKRCWRRRPTQTPALDGLVSLD